MQLEVSGERIFAAVVLQMMVSNTVAHKQCLKVWALFALASVLQGTKRSRACFEPRVWVCLSCCQGRPCIPYVGPEWSAHMFWILKGVYMARGQCKFFHGQELHVLLRTHVKMRPWEMLELFGAIQSPFWVMSRWLKETPWFGWVPSGCCRQVTWWSWLLSRE